MSSHLMKKSSNSNCIDDGTSFLQLFQINKEQGKNVTDENIGHDDQSNYDINYEDDNDELSIYFASYNPYIEHSEDSLAQELKPISDYISSFNPLGDDTQNDLEQELKPISDFISSFNPLTDDLQNDTLDHIEPNTNQISDIEENAVTYIAGYVSCRLLSKHDCDSCKTEFLERHVSAESNSNIYLKEKGGHKTTYLQNASLGFFDTIRQCEKVFQLNINKVIHENDIKAKMINKIKNLLFCQLNICPKVKEEMITLYVKMRLHYFANFFNRNIKKRQKSSSGERKNRKLMKVSH